jgi:hypothetical protein
VFVRKRERREEKRREEKRKKRRSSQGTDEFATVARTRHLEQRGGRYRVIVLLAVSHSMEVQNGCRLDD